MPRLFLSVLVTASVLAAPAAFAECPPPFAFSWGWPGTGPGAFGEVADIAVTPSGDVFAIDARNRRVQKFTRDGHFVYEIESGQYTPSPASIGVDGDGSFYLVYRAQPGTGKIQKFGVTGWTRSTSGWGYGVAVGGDGNVYVLSNSVWIWSSDGVALGSWGAFNEANDIAVSPSDEVYVADDGWIRKFSAEGVLLGEWNGAPNGHPYRSLAVDGDGNVHAATGPRIYVFSPTGQILCSWGTPGREPGQLHSVTGIGVNASGDVYVSDYPDRIQMFGTRLPSDDPPHPPAPPPPPPPPPTPPPPPSYPPVTAGHDAGIILHLASPAQDSCSGPPSLDDIVTAGTSDPSGTRHFVYLLATPDTRLGTEGAGVGGMQLGITYTEDTVGRKGVRVLGWHACATLQFNDGHWPATRSGNTITWGTDELCRKSDVAVAGVFDVMVYGTSMMSVAPWPVTGEVKFADCGAAEGRILSLSQVGWISMGGADLHGDSNGCNPAQGPCQGPTPVLDTTWGRIKTRYR